ncbi:unnamed protein product, partial [Ectocarpus sp. 13 AM-2016]
EYACCLLRRGRITPLCVNSNSRRVNRWIRGEFNQEKTAVVKERIEPTRVCFR